MLNEKIELRSEIIHPQLFVGSFDEIISVFSWLERREIDMPEAIVFRNAPTLSHHYHPLFGVVELQ